MYAALKFWRRGITSAMSRAQTMLGRSLPSTSRAVCLQCRRATSLDASSVAGLTLSRLRARRSLPEPRVVPRVAARTKRSSTSSTAVPAAATAMAGKKPDAMYTWTMIQSEGSCLTSCR